MGSFNWLDYIDRQYNNCTLTLPSVCNGSFSMGSFSVGSFSVGSFSLGSFNLGSFSFGSFGFGSFGSFDIFGSFDFGSFDSSFNCQLSGEPLNMFGYGIDLI